MGPLERAKVELTLSKVFCETLWMKGNCGVVKGVVMPDWSMKTMPKPERKTVLGVSMKVRPMRGATLSAGVAVDTEIVELLGGEVEDGALVCLFDGGEVEGVAGAEVEGETVGDLPVILEEVLLDLVAGADLAGLEIDLEGIDLAEKKTCDGVAAVGDPLLIRTSGGEGEGAGGIRRGDGVELVPAEVDACTDGVAAAGEDDGVEKLPDSGLEPGRRCWRGAELLRKPVKVKSETALLKAALVGMPGIPSAVDAVVGRVGPVTVLPRRV